MQAITLATTDCSLVLATFNQPALLLKRAFLGLGSSLGVSVRSMFL